MREGVVSEDGFLGGALRLKQPVSGHRAGHDAILLAAATPARAGECVVEFGAGVGAAALALARRVPDAEYILVERDAQLVALAADNIAANNAAARAVELDVTARPGAFIDAGLPPGCADRVLMNPPFNGAGRHQASPNSARRIAHEAADDTLDLWIKAARRLLKPGGTLTLIWRPEGLADVLTGLTRGFGAVTILPVHAKEHAPALRILVRATSGARAPMALLPGLVLNDASGQPSTNAQAILLGQAVLPLAEV